METQTVNYTIQIIEQKVREGAWNLNPPYQRGEVYSLKNKRALIETILLKLVVPPIVMVRCPDDPNSPVEMDCVDGKQRCLSITEFLQNKFTFRSSRPELNHLNGKYFKDFDNISKKTINNFVISSMELSSDMNVPEIISEVFYRINMTGKRLNKQEGRDSIWNPIMFNGVKNLSETYISKLIDVDVSRRKDRALVAGCIALGVNWKVGYKGVINKMSDDLYYEKSEKVLVPIIQKSSKVLNFMDQFLTEKYNSEHLIMALFACIYNFDYNKSRLLQDNKSLNEKIKNYLKENEWIDLTWNHSTDLGKTKTRVEKIRELLKDYETIHKTAKRIFSPADKKILWDKTEEHICPICGGIIKDMENAEVDHIIPYSKGGETNLENAQLVHSYCNRKKGGN